MILYIGFGEKTTFIREFLLRSNIVVALIKELQKIGIDDISVVDGAFLDLDATAQLEERGMRTLVKAVGGYVINLDQSKSRK